MRNEIRFLGRCPNTEVSSHYLIGEAADDDWLEKKGGQGETALEKMLQEVYW